MKWLALIAAAGVACAAQAQEKVVLGMSGWTGFQPLKLAELAGIFKKNGVDMEIRFIAPVQRSAALASGALNAAATTVDQHIGGLIVQTDQFFTIRRDQLVLLTTRHAIPTIFGWREFAVPAVLLAMERAYAPRIVRWPPTRDEFSRAKNPPICRSSRRPRSRQWSISELLKR